MLYDDDIMNDVYDYLKKANTYLQFASDKYKSDLLDGTRLVRKCQEKMDEINEELAKLNNAFNLDDSVEGMTLNIGTTLGTEEETEPLFETEFTLEMIYEYIDNADFLTDIQKENAKKDNVTICYFQLLMLLDSRTNEKIATAEDVIKRYDAEMANQDINDLEYSPSGIGSKYQEEINKAYHDLNPDCDKTHVATIGELRECIRVNKMQKIELMGAIKENSYNYVYSDSNLVEILAKAEAVGTSEYKYRLFNEDAVSLYSKIGEFQELSQMWIYLDSEEKIIFNYLYKKDPNIAFDYLDSKSMKITKIKGATDALVDFRNDGESDFSIASGFGTGLFNGAIETIENVMASTSDPAMTSEEYRAMYMAELLSGSFQIQEYSKSDIELMYNSGEIREDVYKVLSDKEIITDLDISYYSGNMSSAEYGIWEETYPFYQKYIEVNDETTRQKFYSTAYNVGTGVGNYVPILIASSITSGFVSSFIPALSPVAANTIGRLAGQTIDFRQAYRQHFVQNYYNGYDTEIAAYAALLSASGEVAADVMLDSIPGVSRVTNVSPVNVVKGPKMARIIGNSGLTVLKQLTNAGIGGTTSLAVNKYVSATYLHQPIDFEGTIKELGDMLPQALMTSLIINLPGNIKTFGRDIINYNKGFDVDVQIKPDVEIKSNIDTKNLVDQNILILNDDGTIKEFNLQEVNRAFGYDLKTKMDDYMKKCGLGDYKLTIDYDTPRTNFDYDNRPLFDQEYTIGDTVGIFFGIKDNMLYARLKMPEVYEPNTSLTSIGNSSNSTIPLLNSSGDSTSDMSIIPPKIDTDNIPLYGSTANNVSTEKNLSVFRNNQIYLNYVLDKAIKSAKNGDTTLSLDLDKFSVKAWNKTGMNLFGKLVQEGVISTIPENNLLEIIDYCIKTNHYEIIEAMNQSLFTDKIKEKVKTSIVDVADETMIKKLSKSSPILNICLECERYDLLKYFDSSSLNINSSIVANVLELYKKNPNIIKDDNYTEKLVMVLEEVFRNLESDDKKRAEFFGPLEQYEDLLENFTIDVVQNNVDYIYNHRKKLLDKICDLYDEDIWDLFFPELTLELLNKHSEIILYLCEKQVQISCANKNLIEFLEKNRRYDLIKKMNFYNIFPNITLETRKYFSEHLDEELINKLSKTPYLIKFFPKFTPKILDKYGSLIINNIDYYSGYLMYYGEYYITTDKNLFKYLFDKNKVNFIKFMYLHLTDEIINEVGDKIIMECVEKYNIFWHDKCFVAFLIRNNRYNLLKRVVDSDESLKFVLQMLENEFGISREVLKYKIDYLSSKNSRIMNTLNFEILKYNIPLDILLVITLYHDIQKKIINLDDITRDKFIEIYKIIQTKNYDLLSVIESILNNISNYEELLTSIDVKNLSEEEFNNLIYILQRENNIFDIWNYSDLINFDKKKNDYFESIDANIDNLSKEELQEAIVEAIYGMNLEEAKFMCDRYSYDFDFLGTNGLSEEIVSIIKAFNKILTEENKDVLKLLFRSKKNIQKLKTSFWSPLSLEASIRKEYAKMYINTLYQLSEKDLSKNPMLTDVMYNGKKISIYEPGNEFCMQIHVLGAYNIDYQSPVNYKNDWLRPEISSHGICTSYISHNEIATSEIEHPILGFSNYEESALLLAGNYDLGSDRVNERYVTSNSFPHHFLPPKIMIDSTRYYHNEMVIERINRNMNKRTPNYIVYIVDDINDSYNFDENNSLYQETLQAAYDFDIPIVVIDRLKYAKLEKEKCDMLEKEFYSSRNPKILRELFLNYMNNNLGCHQLKNNLKAECYDVFSDEVVWNFYERITDFIESDVVGMNDTEITHEEILTMIKLLRHEIEMKNIITGRRPVAPFDLYDALDEYQELLDEFNTKKSN